MDNGRDITAGGANGDGDSCAPLIVAELLKAEQMHIIPTFYDYLISYANENNEQDNVEYDT